MQISLDQYVRNFRIFYQQLIRDHSNEDQLNKKFKLLIENQLKKWKKLYGISKISETSSDHPLLAKIRESRKGKQQNKVDIDIYHSSNSISDCIVFGYLYLVFQYNNIASFQYLQEELKAQLEKKEVYTTPILRKVTFIWGKFNDIIMGKRRTVKFDKQLQQYFKQLPKVFKDSLYNIILQGKVPVTSNKQVYFQQLANFSNIRVDYFQINQKKELKTWSYGTQFQYAFKIGYFIGENMYVNVGKMPERQQKQVTKEKTLQKFALISSSLNQMYSSNMKEYLNLSNLKNRTGQSSFISNNLVESRKMKESRNKVEVPEAENGFMNI